MFAIEVKTGRVKIAETSKAAGALGNGWVWVDAPETLQSDPNFSTAGLVDAFNALTGESVKRAASKAAIAKRLWRAMVERFEVVDFGAPIDERRPAKVKKKGRPKKAKMPVDEKVEKVVKKRCMAGSKLTWIGDGFGPFREKSWTGRTIRLMIDNPGSTKKEILDRGGRERSISHLISLGYVTFE